MEADLESPLRSIMEVMSKLVLSIAHQQDAVLDPLESRLIMHFFCYYTAMMKASLDNLETVSERLGALRAVLAEMMAMFDAPQLRNLSGELDGLRLSRSGEQSVEEAAQGREAG